MKILSCCEKTQTAICRSAPIVIISPYKIHTNTTTNLQTKYIFITINILLLRGYLQPVGKLFRPRPRCSHWSLHRSALCTCRSHCTRTSVALDGELLLPGMTPALTHDLATCAPTWCTCNWEGRRQLDIVYLWLRRWSWCLWLSLWRQECLLNKSKRVINYRLNLK